MVSLQSCKDDLSDLNAKVDVLNGNNFASLKELWDYCRDKGEDSLNGRIKTLEDFMDALNKLDIDNDGEPDFVDAFKDLRDQVNALSSYPLDEIDTRLTDLYSQVDNLVDRLSNTITGLIVQRAFGPAFGDFSLPIGVQSNMLFNWYGEKVDGTPDKFPSQDGDDIAAGIKFSDLCSAPINLDGSEYEDIDLGEIYLTVNPIGHNFDGEKLTLENSLGNKLGGNDTPYALEIEANPNYLLKFGTRASAPVTKNGLYKASLKIKKADIAAGNIDVTPDASALKSAAKAAVKNPSVSTAGNLVKAVYDQITAKEIPAYALRYDWTSPTGEDGTGGTVKWTYDPTTKKFNRVETPKTTADGKPAEPTTGDYAVLSKYEIAVITAKPLSFNAFKKDGDYTSKRLPTGNLANFFERLKNKALDKINFNAETTVDGHSVVLGNITFSQENEVSTNVTAKGDITVDGIKYDVEAIAALDDIIKEINDKIVQKVCSVIYPGQSIEQIQEQHSDVYAQAKLKIDTVLLQMNNEINNIITDIKGTIRNSFESVENSNYFELANRAFNLYNRFANKVNEFLADPNAALQVAALYDTNDGIGFLSQSESDPTIFTGSGDKIKIYLTTNTGEIVAPAFKKFFACENVTSLNSSNEDLGKVLEGSQKSVEISGLTAGDYTFVYQALDYSGFTSTKKFYITVK